LAPSTDTGLFAIALYVPDLTLKTLKSDDGLRGLIVDGVHELDFLPPPWWERSHTARLGLMYDESIPPGAS
jgi:hypothetical protein